MTDQMPKTKAAGVVLDRLPKYTNFFPSEAAPDVWVRTNTEKSVDSHTEVLGIVEIARQLADNTADRISVHIEGASRIDDRGTRVVDLDAALSAIKFIKKDI